jgi:hypothetical protein
MSEFRLGGAARLVAGQETEIEMEFSIAGGPGAGETDGRNRMVEDGPDSSLKLFTLICSFSAVRYRGNFRNCKNPKIAVAQPNFAKSFHSQRNGGEKLRSQDDRWGKRNGEHCGG